MAEIVDGPHHEDSPDPSEDGDRYRWRYRDDGDERDVTVLISRSAANSQTGALMSPIGVAVETQGGSAVEESLQRGRKPKMITVNTSGLWESEYNDRRVTGRIARPRRQ